MSSVQWGSLYCVHIIVTRKLTGFRKNNYFFTVDVLLLSSYRPSSLDALVFGAFAPLLKVPFPVPLLRNHLKGCSNLWDLCQRILDRYFPLSQEGMYAVGVVV